MAMIYKHLGAFVFGGMASCSLTNIAKMPTGNLRPHFLVVCLPDWASFNCESGYIMSYTCTGHPEDILNARPVGGLGGEPRKRPLLTPAAADVSPPLSPHPGNPSEHASFGIYAMVCLVVSAGGRQATHPARSQNAPLFPHTPMPCLVPAVPGTASIELVWVPPGVAMASMGRAYLLLRLIQCPCPTMATSRTLSPPPCSWRRRMPGQVPCQGWFCQEQGAGKPGPAEV